MKKIYSNIIIFGVIALVVSMGVISFFIQKNTNEQIAPEINQKLIQPYSNAIKNKDYEFAYYKFTSDNYKEKYSLEEFIKKQELNIEQFGKLQNIISVSGLYLKEKSMHGPWTFKGTMMYNGEKKSQRIIFQIIKEENTYKLYNSYRSFVSIRTKKSEIF